MMIKMGLKVVMGSVRKKLGAPISTTDISPSKYLPILCMPALFLLPTDDEILTIPMMQEASQKFSGPKTSMMYGEKSFA